MKFSQLIIAFAFTALVLLNACKTDSGEKSIFANHPQLDTLKSMYDEKQDVQSANELLRGLQTVLSNPELEEGQMIPFLTYGFDVASSQKMTSRMASFLFPLIKEDYDNPATPDRIYQLVEIMGKLKKESVAIILSQGLQQSFPTYEKLSNLNYTLPEGVPNVDAYVKQLGTQIFDNPDNTGINRKASLAYVDACEAYALGFPNDDSAADNLFKAAEVAKSLRTFSKSLSLYDWVIDKYPNYEKAATALFLKGFIIENNIGDDEKAREIYNDFIAKYPQHELADDVEFLLENIGKTDEEILQMIEQRRKENQAADS